MGVSPCSRVGTSVALDPCGPARETLEGGLDARPHGNVTRGAARDVTDL
jgi:hypothetical protein